MQSLRKGTESLDVFNNFSSVRYAENVKQVENYSKLLREMKEDLDLVFKRIRALKAKVAAKHPVEFAQVVAEREEPDDDDD
ncbi:hypothetical protein HK104_002592 [Borealophlyctis nickersoniae]|nr:hypothetical protein HK104_002592 [Borealophlyctis nickersoniae]